MIIVKMSGGLGNQLFQYSCGRQLAVEQDVELVLDISHYTYSPDRKFELNFFNTHGRIANDTDLKKIAKYQGDSLIKKIYRKMEGLKPVNYRYYIQEPHYHYWPSIRNVQEDVYLDGYWQSQKYFQDITEIIKSDLRLNEIGAVGLKHDLINRIDNNESVSLHVRRGDYVNSAKTYATHGICSLDYYKEAVVFICNKVINPLFIIFSDDIDWCKKSLNFLEPALFIEDENNDYEDMYYMSLCKHHIIANSTFSWWGAWLGNGTPDSYVIAPRNWFNNPSYQDKDLIPEDWLRL